MAWDKADDWKNALEPIGMTEFFKDNAIPDGIDGVLSDGNWEVIFHQYAQAEFAAENVEFLRAVRTFEISGDLNQAAEIYKEFVADSSPRQVNLRGSVRTDLDEIFGPDKEGIGPPSVFDAARNEIINMIRNDTFPRFKASAVKAQQELADPVDWDNIEGRERSDAVGGPAEEEAGAGEPAPVAMTRDSVDGAVVDNSNQAVLKGMAERSSTNYWQLGDLVIVGGGSDPVLKSYVEWIKAQDGVHEGTVTLVDKGGAFGAGSVSVDGNGDHAAIEAAIGRASKKKVQFA